MKRRIGKQSNTKSSYDDSLNVDVASQKRTQHNIHHQPQREAKKHNKKRKNNTLTITVLDMCCFIVLLFILLIFIHRKRSVGNNNSIKKTQLLHFEVITPEKMDSYTSALDALHSIGYKRSLFNESISIIEQDLYRFSLERIIQEDNKQNTNDNLLRNSHHQAQHQLNDIDNDNIALYKIPMDRISPQLQALDWISHDLNESKFFNNITSTPSSSSSRFYYENFDKHQKVKLFQRFALAMFYFSTGGDLYWNQCSSADTIVGATSASIPCPQELGNRFLSHHDDECTWYGITCNPPDRNNPNMEQRIIMIDMTNNSLHTTTNNDEVAYYSMIPKELIMLSGSLQLLWLPQNPQLKGTIPEWIDQFKHLKTLSLYQTGISGTIPLSFYQGLKELESLRLYESNFQGRISDEIKHLKKLKWLWIHGNELSGTIPEGVRHLHSLEGVTLFHNHFTMKNNREEEEEDSVLCKLNNIQLLWTDCYHDDDVKERTHDEYDGVLLPNIDSVSGRKRCDCCTGCFNVHNKK